MSTMTLQQIKLNKHQSWVKLTATKHIALHKTCKSRVYEDDQCNRFCTDKNCMGSYYGIDFMEELIEPVTGDIT